MPQQTQAADDPFGMTAFSPSSLELDRQIANNDREMLELQASRRAPGVNVDSVLGYDKEYNTQERNAFFVGHLVEDEKTGRPRIS